jgi:hypothetical protein
MPKMPLGGVGAGVGCCAHTDCRPRPTAFPHPHRATHCGTPQFRIGGGAADDVLYTGVGGAAGNCSTGGKTIVCVNAAMWDAIIGFCRATNVKLVWDLSVSQRDSNNACACVCTLWRRYARPC